MDQPAPNSTVSRWADSAGRFLALVAVLTPAAGAAIRWIAFSFDPQIPDPLGLALASSIPDLVYTAARVILPALAILAFVLVFARLYEPHRPARTEQTSWRSQRLAIAIAAVVIVIASPNFPAGCIAGIGSMASGWMLAGRMRYPLTTAIIPAVTVFLTASVLAGALSIRLPVSMVTTAPTSPLASGDYIWMGSADGFVYLRTCGPGPTRIVGLAADLAEAREMKTPGPPPAYDNLVDVLARGGHPVWGIRYDC